MTHQNDSSHVDGPILIRNGLDNVTWRITLPLVAKIPSDTRWPFAWKGPWQVNKILDENTYQLIHIGK